MGFSNVYGVPRWGQRDDVGAAVIDGKGIAAEIRAEVAARVAAIVADGGRPPALATILVGEDPASQVYVGAKHRACAEAGIRSLDVREPADCGRERLIEVIAELSADPEVDGILLQLPLPDHLDGAEFVDLIPPAKDVDGLSTASTGALWRGRGALAPCTPSGVMELLGRIRFDAAGRRAVIVGRSELVGKPLAAMLLAANATVTICHSRTVELEATCTEADLLVAAVGKPGLIGPEHVKPGAVVIDVGINGLGDGIAGDVDFERVAGRAGAITPVPGGVGPMTIACLLRNTLQAASSQ
ncbi:MAG: bifunctional 5,10-methylenetetrahydrofolate dehydrogenase/5,10-methenyltetrahydrofolate cyclohydrolase [Actinobacteria bacterium]|nr:bifunctional 5,10-methylenetetrahydrofolate dehydrogenase/5,10-methenyltetrahydrofolate cyclohydrolase [Actinomycetota bacterium]